MDLLTVISHVATIVVGGVVGYFSRRPMDRATIAEKDASAEEKRASAVKLLADASESMARQLKAFEAEVPLWKKKFDEESSRADEAERYNNRARRIQEQAAIIAEHLTHISYMKEPDEPESKLERRFREIKEACHIIEQMKLPERDTLVLQVHTSVP